MTPKEQGFYMPAEWAPHEAIWLSWPHDAITFPTGVEKVEQQYVKVIKALQDTGSERVCLFVRSEAEKERIGLLLAQNGVDTDAIEVWIQDYADVWIRDYGPAFLLSKDSKALAMVNWDFNAWGNKYETLLKDNQIPSVINSKMHIQSWEPGVVMEGGSIDVNGSGSLLTTKQCLLNPNRNPNLTQREIEHYLCEYYGVSNIIWLNEGVEGDDTDGHIDDIARFVAQDTILYAWEENENDANHAILKENLDILKNAKDENGNPFKLVPMLMPKVNARREDGSRLPASYVNFYIANKCVLAPIFGVETDAKALEVLTQVFPDRAIVPVQCIDWILGNGVIHCSSQQQPKTK